MGNIPSLASLVFKRTTKPIKNYNLESRVNKVLSREKPKPAPRHPAPVVKYSEDVSAQMQKDIYESDPALLKRLEEVYVTSEDIGESNKNALRSLKPLPVAREYVGDFQFGYFEPKTVPYGKATLKNIIDFITRHNEEPEVWNSQRISEEYKLDKTRIENILKYFDTYTLVLPPSKDKKSMRYNRNDTKVLGASNVIQIPAAEPSRHAD